ncbi:MAG: GNAT family N-acetyltransferase [Gammaproteobacteria bacterium]|nr:GNAT family N-acetyltransferase [Gammaproteobacteria bacterium]
MNISDFRVEPADYKADFDDLRAVREAVFINEQNIPEAIEFDAADPNCHHVVARDNQHRAIGTARLSPEGNIGRMAVLPYWRGKGVGKALILAVLDKAQKLGFTEVSLNAQAYLVDFYRKFGFHSEGDAFTVANIPHQLMRSTLKPLEKTTRPVPKQRSALVEIAEFSSIDEITAATLALIGAARKEIRLYSKDLEPFLYGRSDVLEALKQFAINSSGGSILIIVQDTLAVRADPHPLIDLAQRLPSIFTIRTPIEPADLQYPSAYLINDRDGYCFRQQSSVLRGVWSPVMPSRNRQLMDDFDTVWERCRVCTEFRALGI